MKQNQIKRTFGNGNPPFYHFIILDEPWICNRCQKEYRWSWGFSMIEYDCDPGASCGDCWSAAYGDSAKIKFKELLIEANVNPIEILEFE